MAAFHHCQNQKLQINIRGKQKKQERKVQQNLHRRPPTLPAVNAIASSIQELVYSANTKLNS